MRGLLKRWWVWLVGLLLAATLSVAGVLISHGSTPINQATFDRIHVGMTEQEVESLLGGPATWDGLDRDDGNSKLSSWSEGKSTEDFMEGGTIDIWFGDDGKVAWKRFSADKRPLIDRLKKRIGKALRIK